MELFKKLTQLETQAKEYGFYWPNSKTIIKQISSEVIEIEELLDNKECSAEHLQEEIGDLLHAAFSLCLYYNYDPKITLKKSLEKFEKRFNKLKELALNDGFKDLHSKPTESTQYWEEAKKF